MQRFSACHGMGLVVAVVWSGACNPREPDPTEQEPIHMTLEATLTPRSGEVIDCFGGSILPAVLPDDEGISQPDTLVFLNGVDGVQIRNCTLEATFPIVLFDADDNTIEANTLRSSSEGVLLIASSANLVLGNEMESAGRNVGVLGDSDRNRIERNTLSFANGPAADGLPGWPHSSPASGVGIGVSAYPGVYTVIVNGELRQSLALADTGPDDTEVVDNHIVNHGGRYGVAFSTRASHASATGNTIEGGEVGLTVNGYADLTEFLEPGACSGDPTIACNEDGICSAFDAGTCEGTSVVTGGGRVISPTLSSNRVEDATVGISVSYAQGHTVEANDLHQNCAGIELFAYAIESGSVKGNAVQSDLQCEQYVTGGVVGTTNIGMKIGYLGGEEPGAFGVEIGFNDLGDTELPIDLWTWSEQTGSAPFGFAATLEGNWYGDQPCGLPAEATWWPDVTDPTATAAPVAEAWRQGQADAVARCN